MKKEKLIIPKSKLEKILELLSIIEVILIWGYLLYSWSTLPSKIPTHFNFAGKPDSWGGKGALLFVPIIFTILYVIITVVAKFPESFNYVVEITEENKEREYKNAREMMTWLSFLIASMALYMEFQSVQVAKGVASGLGVLFVIVEVIAMFGILGYYIYKMVKLK